MSLTTTIIPETSKAIWREVQTLARPLISMVTKAAQETGLDPNYLAWLIRSGEHWPRLPADQAATLRVGQRLLHETRMGEGRFLPPSDLMQEEQSTDSAMRDIGTQMPNFKKSLAEAYVKGLSSMSRQVKEWRRGLGGSPWSDRQAQMFLHKILQDELRGGGRGITKPVLLWEIIQAIS